MAGAWADDAWQGLTAGGGTSPPPPVPPGTGSVAERLGWDVAQVVNALGICGRVVVRRHPTVLDKPATEFPVAGKPLGIIVVQRGNATLLWARPGPDQGVDEVEYAVGIALVIPSKMVVGLTADMNSWVELVRQAVRGTMDFPTTPEFSESNLTTKVPFERPVSSDLWTWGWLGLSCKCQETRG